MVHLDQKDERKATYNKKIGSAEMAKRFFFENLPHRGSKDYCVAITSVICSTYVTEPSFFLS